MIVLYVVSQHAGTALNPAKAGQKPYDGRYDEYIMTDSEEEREIDDKHGVGFAAEVACILAIGCVAGLKGLSKMRKGVKLMQILFIIQILIIITSLSGLH